MNAANGFIKTRHYFLNSRTVEILPYEKKHWLFPRLRHESSSSLLRRLLTHYHHYHRRPGTSFGYANLVVENSCIHHVLFFRDACTRRWLLC